MKKIIVLLIIVILFISFPTTILADDFDEEDVSKEEIENQLVEASANVDDIPKTSSRSVLILDKELT